MARGEADHPAYLSRLPFWRLKNVSLLPELRTASGQDLPQRGRRLHVSAVRWIGAANPILRLVGTGAASGGQNPPPSWWRRRPEPAVSAKAEADDMGHLRRAQGRSRTVGKSARSRVAFCRGKPPAWCAPVPDDSEGTLPLVARAQLEWIRPPAGAWGVGGEESRGHRPPPALALLPQPRWPRPESLGSHVISYLKRAPDFFRSQNPEPERCARETG